MDSTRTARSDVMFAGDAGAAVRALASTAPTAPTVSGQAEALVAAADAEADEAAGLLHDGPVQTLICAQLAAEAVVRGAGDPGSARDAVHAALVELRRFLWHLRPRGAAEAGLVAALAGLSDRLVEEGRPPLGLLLDESAAAALPPSISSVLFRLVQACARPPAAGPVRVRLRRGDRGAVLDVDGGAPLAAPELWAAKLSALGGDLTASATGLRLAVPLLESCQPQVTKAIS